jgi:hypothetical protein
MKWVETSLNVLYAVSLSRDCLWYVRFGEFEWDVHRALKSVCCEGDSTWGARRLHPRHSRPTCNVAAAAKLIIADHCNDSLRDSKGPSTYAVFFISVSAYLSVYLSIYLSVCLFVCPSIHPSVYPSIRLSVSLSIYPCIHPPIPIRHWIVATILCEVR